MKHCNIRFLILIAAIAMTMVACQESLEQKAAHEALMYTTKNCPAQMSDNLIMDSMTFDVSTHTLHFHYTLTGVADSVGLLNGETLKKVLRTDLKNTTAMMDYKEAGYQFTYTYHSQKNPNKVLFEVTFDKKDYK